MNNLEYNFSDIVGETFEDLSISEMVQVQGSGDVSAETTAPCLYTWYYATLSSTQCAATVSAVSGAVLSIAKC